MSPNTHFEQKIKIIFALKTKENATFQDQDINF